MKFKELIAKINKEHGEDTATQGREMPQTPRLPSGIFAFDLATGGGIPRNRMSMIYGGESSGKTNLCLVLVAQHQKLYPDLVCVYVDIEGTLTSDWARSLGVDWDKLVVIRPSYAEQCVDIVTEILHEGDNCGLMVLDSIAALASMAELSKSSEIKQVGGMSQTINSLVKQCTSLLTDAGKSGDYSKVPTILWVNQIRMSVGTYGNPETYPGGKGQAYMQSLRIRLSGKNITDSEYNKVMPVRKYTKGIIQKWKNVIHSIAFEYEMAMIEHGNMKIGQTRDWPVIKAQLMANDLLAKAKDGWVYKVTGEEFPTQVALAEWLHGEPKHRSELIETLLAPMYSDELNTVDEEGNCHPDNQIVTKPKLGLKGKKG
jgi:recombination protein RecA